jgi:hypothetical protein
MKVSRVSAKGFQDKGFNVVLTTAIYRGVCSGCATTATILLLYVKQAAQVIAVMAAVGHSRVVAPFTFVHFSGMLRIRLSVVTSDVR